MSASTDSVLFDLRQMVPRSALTHFFVNFRRTRNKRWTLEMHRMGSPRNKRQVINTTRPRLRSN